MPESQVAAIVQIDLNHLMRNEEVGCVYNIQEWKALIGRYKTAIAIDPVDGLLDMRLELPCQAYPWGD